MKLFSLDGYDFKIDPMALTLKPFKKIWDRDKTKSKITAINQLSWIYFMFDPRSDYQYIIDESERSKQIKEGLGMDEKWEPDNIIVEASEFYTKFKSTSELLLDDTRAAVEKLRKKLRDIDLDQLDDKGKPIYTLNIIVSTIKQVPSLIKDLDEAEKTLAREIAQADKARGSLEKAIYEDL